MSRPRARAYLLSGVASPTRYGSVVWAADVVAPCLRALLRDVLVARRHELAPGVEPAMAAMILGSAIEAAIHTAIFERPECLRDGALAAELERLCTRYLVAP